MSAGYGRAGGQVKIDSAMAQTKKEDVRAGIVASARQEFEQRGYAASTIRSIAQRAGMSPSNVYVYFDSKLDILFAIYDP